MVKQNRNLVINRTDFPHLFTQLHEQGYEIIGPTRSQNAISYTQIKQVTDLPTGWIDEQEAGMYRLAKKGDEVLFGYGIGPHPWKRLLYPPIQQLWQAVRDGNGKGFKLQDHQTQTKKSATAFIGIRACDLTALQILDKVFTTGPYQDTNYTRLRAKTLIIAVNCSRPSSNCFCTSMKTGPKVTQGYDLALTEIYTSSHHNFLVEVGSERGAEILKNVPHQPATPTDIQEADQVITDTIAQMHRALDTTDIKNLLYRNLENPHWNEIAKRCLTCGNCTMVCPTCFCSTVEDASDLTGTTATRIRKMDVCYTLDFSYIHGGSVRASSSSRYRQWLTHKLASWIDQFGVSGCVGCGRCITWCPVGIDLTEEIPVFRKSELKSA